MPFDGIVLHKTTEELNILLGGGRIEKIFQTGSDEIVLGVHSCGEHYRLLMSASGDNPRIHLTKEKNENPMIAPPFSMVLRKYILGGKISSVSQYGCDRIVTLNIDARNDMGDAVTKKLVIEIMGHNSNIILLNENGVIHDSIKHIDGDISRVREIMPARPYVLPPLQDKLSPLDADEHAIYEALVKSFQNEPAGISKRILSIMSGFSPILCDSICQANGIDRKFGGIIPDDSLFRISQSVFAVCLEIRSDNSFPAVLASGRDFHVIKEVADSFGVSVKYSTVNLMLDEFYRKKKDEEKLASDRASTVKIIRNALSHWRKKLELHQKTLDESKDYEKYKTYGELLTGNIYALEDYTGNASVVNYYDETQPEITIPLDPHKTVADNAQLYFKKYRKFRSSYESTTGLRDKDVQELDYLENTLALLENASSPDEIAEIRGELYDEGYGKVQDKKDREAPSNMPQSAFFGGKPASKKSKKAKAYKENAINKSRKQPKGDRKADLSDSLSKPLRFTMNDGYTIFVGKNGRQNDRLTLRDSKPDDIWFHIHALPGSHVILSLPNKDAVPSDELMEKAAKAAAWFSGARNTSKADVDYTRVRNIKKIPGAHPGMVRYNEYKTVTVKPEGLEG